MAKGRPRTDSIPRFNVDTYLSSNRKFILFKRKLGLDEAKTYLTLVRFFNYVNANCSITANLGEVHAESLAEFCFWEREPSELWKTLCEVGFIESNGDVHDQETHQPLAAEIRRKRKSNEDAKSEDEQKQNKANLGGNNRTEVGSNPQPIIYNLEPSTISPESPNGDSIPPQAEGCESQVKTPKLLDPKITEAVKIWNDAKAEEWDYVHDPRKTAGLITRLQTALKLDGFYLPEIIEKARGYPFLASKKFVTLRWLVSKSDKTGNLNAQDIMRGYYDNQTTKPERKQPGCLTNDNENQQTW